MMSEYTESKTVVLGDFTYNWNEFIDYLISENITLYLNKSLFVKKNRVVDRVIKIIHDKLKMNEKF
jgi:uncharacterized protein YaaR (DUF327 family)